MPEHKVAIIGGGYSGSMTAWHLLNQTLIPLSITIIEPRSTLGLGLAYSTQCDQHLLNVPAAGMSALALEPEHFLHYAQRHDPTVSPETFVPRMFFGKYIHDLISTAIATCAAKTHSCERITGSVTDLRPTADGYQLTLSTNEHLDADLVVLALGNLPGSRPRWLDKLDMDSDCYIHNPWDQDKIARIKPDDDVLIVGTGLTAIDKVLELIQKSHKGQVISVSRHGLMPREHLEHPDLSPVQIAIDSVPGKSSVLETLHFVRQRSRQSTWRATVDGLRSCTQQWWQGLDVSQKRKFARYLQTYWDVHRHRMAPVIAHKIQTMQESGQLAVIAGRLSGISATDMDGQGHGRHTAQVSIKIRGGSGTKQFTVQKIINCTGPQAAPGAFDSPLLSRLYDRKLVCLHQTRLGIDCNEHGQIIGPDNTINKTLYAVGPMLKATLLESVAVPEIKHQASDIAKSICSHFASKY